MIKVQEPLLPYNLPNTMVVPFTATFLDVLGNPTNVTYPTVVIDNTNIATVKLEHVPEPGVTVSSITGVISSVGPVGTANLTVSAINPDGSTVSALQVVNVTTSFATGIKIEFGTPTLPSTPPVPPVPNPAPKV